MKSHAFLLLGVAGLAAGFLAPTGAGPKLTVEVAKALSKPCGPCHNTGTPPAGVNPFAFKSEPEAVKSRSTYERMIRALRAGTMPPPEAAELKDDDRAKLIGLIEEALAASLSPVAKPTIRRLNKAEYTYTIEDLLGIQYDVRDEFPNDDVGEGFDNIGDVLTISPLLMERYLQAAEKIAARAIILPGGKKTRIEADKFPKDPKQIGNGPNGEAFFFTNGETGARFDIPFGGSFRISVLASGTQAGDEPCKMAIKVDSKLLQTLTVAAPVDKPIVYAIPADLGAGVHRITVAFTNDYYDPNNPVPAKRDRNLLVAYIELDGPIGMPNEVPPSHSRLIPQRPARGSEKDALRRYLGAFASQAYRRPATPKEVDRIVTVAQSALDEKESFERAMQVGVAAVLCSPHFLFRPELDGAAKGRRQLSSYELASALSYFLWSSMPDDALARLAAQDKLQDPKTLIAQVNRMRQDPKIGRLAHAFAGQWLELKRLDNLNPDKGLFPEYSDELKKDLITETLLFFEDSVRSDRSALEFIDGSTSFVNERVAQLYGITGVTGNNFRRVQLPPQRGGLVGMGSVMMLTSNPNRTSPTKRGKWVMEKMLGAGPPPPPPNVGVLPESTASKPLNLREQLALHRQSPNCAPCHNQIDPLGFALENYSPIGAWRTSDATGPVDNTGILPDGTKVAGALELKKILKAKKDQFVSSLVAKMLTFALGRGVSVADQKTIQTIVASAKAKDYRMSVILEGIVTSDAFRYREANP